MAELVDAVVSNTTVFSDLPVRVRLGVRNKKPLGGQAVFL